MRIIIKFALKVLTANKSSSNKLGFELLFPSLCASVQYVYIFFDIIFEIENQSKS